MDTWDPVAYRQALATQTPPPSPTRHPGAHPLYYLASRVTVESNYVTDFGKQSKSGYRVVARALFPVQDVCPLDLFPPLTAEEQETVDTPRPRDGGGVGARSRSHWTRDGSHGLHHPELHHPGSGSGLGGTTHLAAHPRVLAVRVASQVGPECDLLSHSDSCQSDPDSR